MTGARVLIVGCGRMGAVRAAAVTTLGHHVSALIDTDPGSADALSNRCRGSRVLDADRDVDWAEFDAAFLCTPPVSRDLALDAVRASVPVFIEKPLGLNAASAGILVEEARERGARTAVGYMNRYRPAVAALRTQLRKSPPFAITCHWVVGAYAKAWWNDPAHSGGPLNEQATHLVDLCRFLAGELQAVRAVGGGGASSSGRADALAVALRFHSGACGTLLYSCRASDKHVAIEAFAPDGSHRLQGWDFHSPGDRADEPRNQVFVDETAAFLSGRRVLSDVSDAWRTQVAVDAIKASFDSDARVVPSTMTSHTGPECFSFDSVTFASVRAHGGTAPILFCRARAGTPATAHNFVDLSIVPAGGDIGRHTHTASNEEMYIVISGQARMEVCGEWFDITPGTVIVNPPLGTHALFNPGPDELRLVVIELKVSPA